MRRSAYFAMLCGLAVMVTLVAHQGAGDVLDALRGGGWALGALIPLHLLPQIPDAAGWRVLIAGPRPFNRLYWIAWIRQAVGRLLPLTSIGGELVGVRLLIQGGVAPAQAIASIVVEVLTTMLGQFVFVLIGLMCLLQAQADLALVHGLLLGLVICLPILMILLLLLRRGVVFGTLHRLALSLLKRQTGLADAARMGDRIDRAILLLSKSWHRLTLATTLQLLGMLIGCLEIWAAYRLLGAPLSLSQAVLLESLSQTAKHLIFFVPAAVGVQELTFVALSPVLGVPPDVSLAVALTKRAVDVVVGLPALLSWQWTEARLATARKPLLLDQAKSNTNTSD